MRPSAVDKPPVHRTSLWTALRVRGLPTAPGIKGTLPFITLTTKHARTRSRTYLLEYRAQRRIGVAKDYK